MAPEGFNINRQSPKLDVWSLFATIASVMQAGGFSKIECRDYTDVIAGIRLAAEVLVTTRPMARENPELRASAAQVPRQLYNADGLTTPQCQIGPIPEPGDTSDSQMDLS
jgi:hypothetical protein